MQTYEHPGEIGGSLMQGPPEPVWWGREMFLSVDVPDGKCPAVIDVTGRARVLSYGPYAWLGQGSWRARVLMDLCPDAARRRLVVQFGVSTNFASIDVPRGAPGRREIEVDFSSEAAGLAEVRLVLTRAALHGEVQLLGAEVRAITPAMSAANV